MILGLGVVTKPPPATPIRRSKHASQRNGNLKVLQQDPALSRRSHGIALSNYFASFVYDRQAPFHLAQVPDISLHDKRDDNHGT